jgi:hypothetical protein
MRFRVELSKEAQKQLARFPRDVRERIERAIDEFEARDEADWSNVKALQGLEWKGRLRKKVGPIESFSGSIRSAGRWKFPLSSSDPKAPMSNNTRKRSF